MKTKFTIFLAALCYISVVAHSVKAEEQKADQPPAHTLNDPTRPVYHLVSQSKRSHIADPNFAFYWKGRYHFYYIAARNLKTKERNFVHVSSTDMVHWKHHPETNFGGLSGTLFLSKEGVPTLIAKPSGKISILTPMDDQLEQWEELTNKRHICHLN